MRNVVQLLQYASKQAEEIGNNELVIEIEEAIGVLKNQDMLKKELDRVNKQRDQEHKLYQATENMSPWEKQRYYDSWNGHGS